MIPVTRKLEPAAAQLLGEPINHSLLVLPRGSAPSMMGLMRAQAADQALSAVIPVGGAIGGFIQGSIKGGMGALADKVKERYGKKSPAPQVPMMPMTPMMMLVIGPTQLGLIEWKQGVLRPSLGTLLFHCPKEEVVGFELGAKTRSLMMTGLTLALVDGRRCELEMQRAWKKHAQAMKEALGGQAPDSMCAPPSLVQDPRGPPP